MKEDKKIYTQEELKKIQKIEIEALKELIRICEMKDIEYFLIGGSALGCIRHGGFIPWDDDIDVGMTRENYNKFIKVAPSILDPKYCLQTPSKYTPYFYSKIRVKGTRFVEYANRKNKKMNHGIYIDIFPFDEVPDNEIENNKHFALFQKLIKKYSYRQILDVGERPRNIKGKFRAIFRKIIHLIYKSIPYNVINKKLELCATQFNGSSASAYACLNFPIRYREYIKKEDLYPLIKKEFNDINVNIPNNYEVYLTNHYDNYLELPPEENRIGHKPYFIDLGEYK